jgi:hypothetical protein
VNDFPAAQDDLAAFLDRLAVGTSKKTIPDKPAPTTCRAPEAGAVETEAPPADPEAEETPAPEPTPEEAEPESEPDAEAEPE